jgi:hypothetical protein
VKRWLALGLGLAIAAVAFYLLATTDATPPPTEDIDAASRARLERLLREAEREPGRR